MKYDIKRGAATIATVRPKSGKQSLKIMGENLVSMSFTLNQNVVFEVGDFITVYGAIYTLNVLPNVKKINSRECDYDCKFEGFNYELAKVQLMMLDATNALQDADFSIMGNAATFIDLIVRNMNRVQAGWTSGDVDVTDYKNLTFSGENCLGALSTLATEFKTEFWIIGQTIHFTKKGIDSGLTFEYGKNNGLYTISRQNKDSANVVTRLYAFGGTRNIPSDYRNYANRLRIPLTANAGNLFIEQNVAQYGTIEHSELFNAIYPKRTGTISAIDNASFLKFSDAAIDFNVNDQLLPGVAAKVIFQTGQLAGYEFEISAYNNVTKQFIINVNQQEKAFSIPSALLKPAIGDTYILVDIKMPQTYIDNAEAELLAAATNYLNSNAISRVNYSVECDRLKFERDNITPTLGNNVTLYDADLSINASIRIIGLTRDLINAYEYSLELSESVQPARIIRQYVQQQKIESAIKINNLLDPAKARRNWRDSQELLNLVFDTDGYFTDKIKPLSIETASLSVGARSQQFELNGFVAQANFGANVNEFRGSSAILDHFSIDPTQIVSWNIAASSYSILTTGTAYYIYAKCEKAGVNGTILLSTAKITVDQDATYYHFLLGVLHSTVDTSTPRGLSLNYGQTTVNGKFIKTGKIQSADGNTYFDLDAGEIAGQIKFIPYGGGSPLALNATINTLNANISMAQTSANNAQSNATTALSDAASAAGIANGKGKVLTQSVLPSIPDQNAVTLWIDTTSGANTPKKWNGSAWVAVTDKTATDAANAAVAAQSAANAAQLTANDAKGVTDNFTVISGGLIYSNTLKVGSFGVELAGITAVGTASSSIRFWAGDTYANRAIAPFRVQQDGKVIMSNADITGNINAASGSIAGFVFTSGGFGLNGSKVNVFPNAGINVLDGGFLTVPQGFSSDSLASGKWQLYVKTTGSGASAPPVIGYLSDLQDVGAFTSLTNGQALVYNGTRWINQSIVTDLSNYYTKAQADGKYYLANNPSSFITAAALSPYQLSSGLGSAAYQNSTAFKLSGYTPSNSEVLTALGFTPYNSTNPNGFITTANLSPYALLSEASFAGAIYSTNMSFASISGNISRRDANGFIEYAKVIISGSEIFSATNQGNAAVYMNLSNTSGGSLISGIYNFEGTGYGTQVVTGMTSLAAGFGTIGNTPIQFFTNNNLRFTINSAGTVILTGALNGISASFSGPFYAGSGSFGGVVSALEFRPTNSLQIPSSVPNTPESGKWYLYAKTSGSGAGSAASYLLTTGGNLSGGLTGTTAGFSGRITGSQDIKGDRFNTIDSSATIPFTAWTTFYTIPNGIGVYIICIGLENQAISDWQGYGIIASSGTESVFLVQRNAALIQLRLVGQSIQIYQNGGSPSIGLSYKIFKVQ